VIKARSLILWAILLVRLSMLAVVAQAQDLASLEKQIHVKSLDNGLTLVVFERHDTPVFSVFTHVDVGSDRDLSGLGGLAHMVEHMAFKGSAVIGTTDYAAERLALEQVEKAYAAYQSQHCCDAKKSAELQIAWKNAVTAADKYVIRNQFSAIIQREGGAVSNAFTNRDETGYYYSLPSNRLELWAFLESERFLHPVMREFYKERDVVMEERRTQIDNQPLSRFREQFLAAAFLAHPYRNPIVGWPYEIQNLSATDALRFFEQYYTPSNITIAIAGDVDPAEVWDLTAKYFGRLPARPKPGPLLAIEPPQNAERQIVVREGTQPFFMEGYHRPGSTDRKDDIVLAIIDAIVCGGHTSRMYQSLVRDKQIAASVSCVNGYPGQKYPSLFVLSAVPLSGHTPNDVAEAIHAILEELKSQDVTDEELARARLRLKASLVQIFDNDSEIASALAISQARWGDWRELLRRLDRLNQITKSDVRQLANAIFVPSNRTVGMIIPRRLAASSPN